VPASVPAPARDARGRWLPGVRHGRWGPGTSGNPGGLPKAIRELRSAAAGHGLKALEVLVGIMSDKEAPHAARIAAADSILDRAGMRPIAVEGDRLEVTTPVDAETLRQQLTIRVLRLIGAPDQPAAIEPPASAPAQLAPAATPKPESGSAP
jgi:hypothetical protein